MDPDSLEGQALIKVQFVTKAWTNIRRKLEKKDEWNEKRLNELLREAQKVYLRREEVKTKTKAKIMIAVARESAGTGGSESKEDKQKGDPGEKTEPDKRGCQEQI